MKTLSFTFGSGACPLVIQDESEGGLLELENLQRLMGGTLSTDGVNAPKAPSVRLVDRPADLKLAEGDALLLRRRYYRMIYKGADSSFLFQVLPAASQVERVWLWRAVIIAGTLWLMLRDCPVVLMHGALIEKDGASVLLSAQSGMGKSTTSRRWREGGGACHADDMILLSYADEQLKAYPLPTWSLCSTGDLTTLHYPSETAIPLRQVVCLDRNDSQDILKETSLAHYMLCIYAACTLFEQFVLKRMPADVREKLIRACQKVTDMLCGRFPPLCFYACLHGDLAPLKELF